MPARRERDGQIRTALRPRSFPSTAPSSTGRTHGAFFSFVYAFDAHQRKGRIAQADTEPGENPCYESERNRGSQHHNDAAATDKAEDSAARDQWADAGTPEQRRLNETRGTPPERASVILKEPDVVRGKPRTAALVRARRTHRRRKTRHAARQTPQNSRFVPEAATSRAKTACATRRTGSTSCSARSF